MLYAGGLLGVVLLLVWLFCIIDVIMTPADEARYLPKLLWLGIVVLLSDLGSILWLLVGRPWPNGSPAERLFGGGSRGRAGAYERSAPAYPEYDRPGRFAATNPEDDDAFLAQVRERAEAQRRSESARRREREQTEAAQRAERDQRRQARQTGPDRPDGGDDDDGSTRGAGAGS